MRSLVAGGSVFRGSAWPLSFALHAGAGAALLLAPLAFDAALPEVRGAAFASVAPPLRLPVVVTVQPRREPARNPTPSRDRARAASASSRSAAPRADAASADQQASTRPAPDLRAFGEVENPADPPEDTGSCLLGCGAGRPFDGPSGDGVGSGPGGGPASAVLRAGVDVRPPRPLRQPAPVYPELARAARVAGRVRVECTLGPDGRVREARVVEGPALLREAALDAVTRWVYTPTLLRGMPVPVRLEVTLDFRLR
ncbi:MAG: energy transducer TonB [Vicinamibacteria bacterium]